MSPDHTSGPWPLPRWLVRPGPRRSARWAGVPWWARSAGRGFRRGPGLRFAGCAHRTSKHHRRTETRHCWRLGRFTSALAARIRAAPRSCRDEARAVAAATELAGIQNRRFDVLCAPRRGPGPGTDPTPTHPPGSCQTRAPAHLMVEVGWSSGSIEVRPSASVHESARSRGRRPNSIVAIDHKRRQTALLSISTAPAHRTFRLRPNAASCSPCPEPSATRRSRRTGWRPPARVGRGTGRRRPASSGREAGRSGSSG